MGGYERDPAPWALDGIPSDFNGRLLEEDWPRFEPLMENAIVRVPGARGDGGRAADQRPRGVHAGRRVHPRADRRARLLGRGRVLRPRPRRRGRDGEARGGVDRRGHAERSTCGRWTRGASARRTGRREYTLARTTRSTRRTTTSSTRATSARPGGRCALSPAYPRLRGARRVVRREVRLGARELVRAERRGAATRALRPRGWAGRHWSPAIGGRAPCVPRGRGALRRVVVREDRGLRRGRGRASRAALREPGRPRRRRDHLHADAERARRDRVRLHGHAARGRSLPDRHRHRLRPARPRLDPRSTLPATARSHVDGRHRPRTPASGSGARRRARSSRR